MAWFYSIYINIFFLILKLAGAIYTSELHGSDETGDGTELKPFKTALKVKLAYFCIFWLI